MRVAVFGASGGIGAALVAQLAARDQVGEVFALSRRGGGDAGKVRALAFDLLDEASIAAAATRMGEGGGIDLCIVATGVLGLPDAADGTLRGPEKSFRQIDGATMGEVFAINAIGPALIARHVLPLFSRTDRAVFAALSARVGSIGDNRLGGWHSYRASKAALNMLVRNFAIELARTRPHAIAVALHPGTVATGLSAPFRGGVRHEVFSPAQCAAHLLGVIDGLAATDSGSLLGWDGKIIQY